VPAMYIERIHRPSGFSRLDVRVKLLIMFLASTLIFVWDSVLFQAAMFLVALSLAISAHMDLRYLRRLLFALVPFICLVVAIHGLWNPMGTTALVTLPDWVPLIGGRLALYWEGLVFGIMVSFRILTPLVVLPLVVMTTDVNELMLGLVRLRVPYKVAFIFSIALRFVPFIFNEIAAIQEAQRLRGVALEKMSIFRRGPLFAKMAVPLILGSLIKAQTLEIVLQSKAFSGDPNRTFMTELRMRSIDYAVLVAGVVLLVGAIFTRARLGWGDFVA
jgi:energy-coupling factor transport system permease protein